MPQDIYSMTALVLLEMDHLTQDQIVWKFRSLDPREIYWGVYIVIPKNISVPHTGYCVDFQVVNFGSWKQQISVELHAKATNVHILCATTFVKIERIQLCFKGSEQRHSPYTAHWERGYKKRCKTTLQASALINKWIENCSI